MGPNKKRPFFSVIVPTYNNEKEIEKCIDSILSQVYRDFELIIIDDGSTDATASICDRYEEEDNRVNVIHEKNKGAAAARNRGLFLAKGQYVYFVDADDWIARGLLQEAAKILDCPNPPDIFMFGLRMIMENGRIDTYPCFLEPGLYPKKRLEKEVYPRMMTPRGKKIWMPVVSSYLWDKIMLRDLLTEHYCRDTLLFMGEESVCAYECIYFADQVYVSPHIMYCYNSLSESSMHRRYHEKLFENNIRLAQYYRKYLGRGNPVMQRQINKQQCSGLRYLIKHELKFSPSIYGSSSRLNKKIKKLKRFPVCPLEGLNFSDKCFVLLISFRLQYFILLSNKMLILISNLKRKRIFRKSDKDGA